MNWYSLYKLSQSKSERKRIKEDGAYKLQIPNSCPYNAYYIMNKAASNLYGAGTKWCTTAYDNCDENDIEFFPNMVYFIHKTKTIKDDPEYYKLAFYTPSAFGENPQIYRYDAQNRGMSMDKFLELLNIQYYQLINILRQVGRYQMDMQIKRQDSSMSIFRSTPPSHTYRYLGQCDKLRQTKEGAENWKKMMEHKVIIPKEEFLQKCDLSELFDADDGPFDAQLDEYIASDQDSYFAASSWGGSPCIFFMTCGFEFIFV